MGYLRLFSSLMLSALLLSAETDYRFAFPQSEILMGVDVKWLMKSPFGEQMRAGLKGGMAESLKGSLGDLQPLESMMESIDGVYISAVSKSAVAKAALPKSAKPAIGSDVLLLVKGRFDLDKLIAMGQKNGLRLDMWGKTRILLMPAAKKSVKPAAGAATLRKAQYQLEPAQFSAPKFSMDGGTQRPFFALYDANTILVGEEAPLRVALERLEGGLTPQANPLIDRARNLESANDFWIVGSMAPLNLDSAMKSGKQEGNDPFSALAKEIRNFSIGVAVRRDVALDLQLQASTPKVASQMQDMMRGLMAMQKATAKPEDALPFDLDKALQLSASGNIFRASLTIEQKELEQIMNSRMVSALSGITPNGGVAAAPAAASPTPTAPPAEGPAIAVAPPVAPPVARPAAPVRKTVMIYGLPGGPKEVPVSQPF